MEDMSDYSSSDETDILYPDDIMVYTSTDPHRLGMQPSWMESMRTTFPRMSSTNLMNLFANPSTGYCLAVKYDSAFGLAACVGSIKAASVLNPPITSVNSSAIEACSIQAPGGTSLPSHLTYCGTFADDSFFSQLDHQRLARSANISLQVFTTQDELDKHIPLLEIVWDCVTDLSEDYGSPLVFWINEGLECKSTRFTPILTSTTETGVGMGMNEVGIEEGVRVTAMVDWDAIQKKLDFDS